MKTSYTSYGTALPVYCSSSFDWNGNKGSCNNSELIKVDTEHMVGEYQGVLVKSSRTGIIKYFEPVHDEDGYDGEFMVYTCAQPNQSESFFVTIWNY